MTHPSKRVLVTGGAGFIGSHVAEAHLAAGDQVWVLDNLSSGRRENVPQGAEFVEMDIRDRGVADLFTDVAFDLVNHHAAQIDVRTSVSEPARDADVNVMGFLNVTEAALRGGTRRMVFISSGGVVYGEPEELPTPESSPKLPLSPYGVTKLAGEQYLFYYHRVRGLEYVSLRYSNVYGPRQDPHGEAGVVAIFSQKLLSGEPLTIYGDGEQTRDYIFVKDIVSANLQAADLTLGGHDDLDAMAFNVGTGVGTSVNRLADLLESVADIRTGRESREPRAGELRHSALDASRLIARGWAPRWDLREGLRATFQSIAELEVTR
jgi:UDP-glucose 4-epimerase